MNHLELGVFGETLAASFLAKKGYIVLAKNIHCKKTEIDIVALDKETLVIVEVKTRQTTQIGEPWKAVHRRKQKHLIAAANYYVCENKIDRDIRFDIVSIVHTHFQTKIEHFVDAFYPVL